MWNQLCSCSSRSPGRGVPWSTNSAGLKLAERTTSSGTSELRRLSTLLEISQTLAAGTNQKSALHQVLGILDRHHSIIRSTVALLSRQRRHRSRGGRRAAGRKSRREVPARRRDHRPRRPEQQADRRAEQSRASPCSCGAPSDRPELAREEISYVCVPILLNRKAVGALGADFRFKPERDFDRTVKFLGCRRVAHGAVDPHSARHRRRARAAARGKHASQERAARALRFLEHPRHERADAARLRAGLAGRAHRHDRAHPRRVGHRQRADRAGDPLQLAAVEAAVHQGELRGAAREPHRVGAVRLRKGRVHRRARDQERAIRAGRGGVALSRRNRRAQPGDADQAAARDSGARVRAAGRHEDAFAPTCA